MSTAPRRTDGDFRPPGLFGHRYRERQATLPKGHRHLHRDKREEAVLSAPFYFYRISGDSSARLAREAARESWLIPPGGYSDQSACRTMPQEIDWRRLIRQFLLGVRHNNEAQQRPVEAINAAGERESLQAPCLDSTIPPRREPASPFRQESARHDEWQRRRRSRQRATMVCRPSQSPEPRGISPIKNNHNFWQETKKLQSAGTYIAAFMKCRSTAR